MSDYLGCERHSRNYGQGAKGTMVIQHSLISESSLFWPCAIHTWCKSPGRPKKADGIPSGKAEISRGSLVDCFYHAVFLSTEGMPRMKKTNKQK